MAKAPKRAFPDLPCTVRDYFERQVWLHVVWRHEGLSTGNKLISSVLADHINFETLRLNPGHSLMADMSNLTEEAVRKGTRVLREAHLIACIAGSGRTSSSYSLLIPAPVFEGGTAIPERLAQTYRAVRDVKALRMVQASRQSGTVIPPNLTETILEPSRVSLSGPPELAPQLERLLHRLRDRNGSHWLGDAEFVSGTPIQILTPSALKASWIRDKFASHLDAIFPQGWSVMERDRAA